MDIIWKMNCNVNNSSFSLNGKGVGDSESGLTELLLKASSYPEGFDAAVCPFICNVQLATCFARVDGGKNPLLEVAGNHFYVQPARIAVIYDEQGQQLLNIAVKSVLSFVDGQLFTSNEMSGFSNLPEIEKGFTPLTSYILPSLDGEATGVVRYRLLTTSGETLHGLTTVAYAWQGTGSISKPYAHVIETAHVDKEENLNVHIRLRSKILSEAPIGV